jgi:hypothetical protein
VGRGAGGAWARARRGRSAPGARVEARRSQRGGVGSAGTAAAGAPIGRRGAGLAPCAARPRCASALPSARPGPTHAHAHATHTRSAARRPPPAARRPPPAARRPPPAARRPPPAARRPPPAAARQVPFAVVFTKVDVKKKGGPSPAQNMAAFKAGLLQEWEALPPCFATSAREGTGRGEVLGFLASLRRLDAAEGGG